MIRKIIYVINTLFLVFICTQSSISQIGSFYLPEAAFDSFSSDFNNSSKNNITNWIKMNGGNVMTKDNVQNYEYYAVYKIYALELWFICSSPSKQSIISENLEQIKRTLSISEEIRNDIQIYEVNSSSLSLGSIKEVPGGSIIIPIKTGTVEEQSFGDVNEQFEKMTFGGREQELMNELRKKFSEQGEIKFQNGKVDFEASKIGEKDEKGSAEVGNGKKAWIPVTKAFSRWFATLVEMFLDYLQITELVKKIVTLAYLVAPDIINNIASELAELQRELTSPVNGALDKISKVAEIAWNIYNDLKNLHSLIQEEGFKELLNETSIGDALNVLNEHTNKYGFDITGKLGKPFQQVKGLLNCVSGSGIDDECFKNQFMNTFSDTAVKHIPGLERLGISPSQIKGLLNGEYTLAELGVEVGKEQICNALPIKRYDSACHDLLNGDVKGAALNIAEAEIGKVLGVNPTEIRQLMQAIEDGDEMEAIKVVGLKILNDNVKSACVTDLIEKNIDDVLSGKSLNKEDAVEALEAILCKVHGREQARSIVRAGKDVHEEYAKLRTTKRIARKTGVPEKEAEDIFNGKIHTSLVDSTIDSLETATRNIKDEKEISIFKSEIGNLKTQKSLKEADSSLKINLNNPKFSDTEWEKWRNNMSFIPRGKDGYTKLIFPKGWNKKEYDPSRRIYFINGILTRSENALLHTQNIANRLNQPVFLVHSWTPENEKMPSIALINDLNEALELSLNKRNTISGMILQKGIEIDLSSGKEVLVFAHSRGAAVTYNTTKSLLNSRSFIMRKSDIYKNLKIVTLGGYCPPINEWSSEIIVKSHINAGDPIPLLRGNQRPKNKTKRIILENHYMDKYYRYIDLYIKN